MGSVPGGPRRPNTTAYFVALAGILVLLVLLICYFLYFCVSKVKELTREDSPLQQTVTSSGPPRISYPIQPVVRESATAMAKICKQIPAGKGDTVFPAASSPAAAPAHTTPDDVTNSASNITSTTDSAANIDTSELQDKLPTHAGAVNADLTAAS